MSALDSLLTRLQLPAPRTHNRQLVAIDVAERLGLTRRFRDETLAVLHSTKTETSVGSRQAAGAARLGAFPGMLLAARSMILPHRPSLPRTRTSPHKSSGRVRVCVSGVHAQVRARHGRLHVSAGRELNGCIRPLTDHSGEMRPP